MHRTLLIGPIDTKQEIEAILAVLRNKYYLSQKAIITNNEIEGFLNELREQCSNQIVGVVDTPREIKILLDILMKKGIICGPVDSPLEIKIFIEKLQQEVIAELCYVNARQNSTPNQKNRNNQFPRL